MKASTLHWLQEPCSKPSDDILHQARNHQDQLTKPAGSLGELERIAIRFSAWQDRLDPVCNSILVRVFAADHGVCAQNVSAFPQEVTSQMLLNFAHGGAAISVLSKALKADFKAVCLGTVGNPSAHPKLELHHLANSTCDFTNSAAMSEAQLAEALNIGRSHTLNAQADLFIAGDMGIGNTSSASAIYAALLGLPACDVVGPGTGLDAQGVAHKVMVVDQALNQHRAELETPLEVLRRLGGFEIAAMTGAYISAAQNGIPSLIDGFISTAAALLAVKLNPASAEWFVYAHRSAEPAHSKAIDYLGARPLLDLDMRLGEGSGAAMAVSLIQNALLLHNTMASFDTAGVSNRED